MINFFIGLIVGGLVGFMLCALCVAGSDKNNDR